MKFFDEFKEFIARGNVMDMAVGVVVGGAFKSIIDSLVSDIINPGIAYIVSIISKAAVTATNVVSNGEVTEVIDMSKWIIPGTSIKIGNFVSAVINFLLLAFIVFCAVKGLNTLNEKIIRKKKEEDEKKPEQLSQEELLTQIRDLLSEKNKE